MFRAVVLLGSAVSAAWGFGYSGSAFSVEGFVPYYNYEGNLTVSGYVTGTTMGTTQTLEYELSGLDPDCVSGAGDAANSCGVHFHEGTDCVSDAGAHFYADTLSEDPWATVAYTSVMSDGDYTASLTDGSLMVETGLTAAEIVGRAFVVHAFDGSRIACALIE
uniref:Superoxide dismutase copper/zinc binding domain-containing protein n=1 Tax=Chrysocystis fragilis TaxID=1411660 RepID=A0A7S0TD05_9STRA|mmetsp:Transcript_245/g.699  ORF Transcript_245/g.699 Transcript_245/m.699 type:complete len:163 (+) Transcript_245:87-575(+)